MENESVFISQKEFANIVQTLPKLFKRFRGKHVVNKFEEVIPEVIRSKYDHVHLDSGEARAAARGQDEGNLGNRVTDTSSKK